MLILIRQLAGDDVMQSASLVKQHCKVVRLAGACKWWKSCEGTLHQVQAACGNLLASFCAICTAAARDRPPAEVRPAEIRGLLGGQAVHRISFLHLLASLPSC